MGPPWRPPFQALVRRQAASEAGLTRVRRPKSSIREALKHSWPAIRASGFTQFHNARMSCFNGPHSADLREHAGVFSGDSGRVSRGRVIKARDAWAVSERLSPIRIAEAAQVPFSCPAGSSKRRASHHRMDRSIGDSCRSFALGAVLVRPKHAHARLEPDSLRVWKCWGRLLRSSPPSCAMQWPCRGRASIVQSGRDDPNLIGLASRDRQRMRGGRGSIAGADGLSACYRQ